MRPIPLFIAALAVLPAGPATGRHPPVANRGADAVAVVQRYYRAIDRGDFRTAYACWGDRGRASGQGYAAFARGFAATAHTRVVPGRAALPEGAAGSVYVEVPVEVWATLKNGRRQHFRGSYVVRRVNDVDGATPAQRRWHLGSARLRAA